MILDYKECVTEKGHRGIVNYVSTESGLPLFSHKSICPFCHTEINNTVYQKSLMDYPETAYRCKLFLGAQATNLDKSFFHLPPSER